MKDLTLYDLTADDHYITARVAKNNDIEIQVLNYDDQLVYDECGSIFGWDSLVSFAKMVIEQDKHIQRDKRNVEL